MRECVATSLLIFNNIYFWFSFGGMCYTNIAHVCLYVVCITYYTRMISILGSEKFPTPFPSKPLVLIHVEILQSEKFYPLLQAST